MTAQSPPAATARLARAFSFTFRVSAGTRSAASASWSRQCGPRRTLNRSKGNRTRLSTWGSVTVSPGAWSSRPVPAAAGSPPASGPPSSSGGRSGTAKSGTALRRVADPGRAAGVGTVGGPPALAPPASSRGPGQSFGGGVTTGAGGGAGGFRWSLATLAARCSGVSAAARAFPDADRAARCSGVSLRRPSGVSATTFVPVPAIGHVTPEGPGRSSTGTDRTITDTGPGIVGPAARFRAIPARFRRSRNPRFR